MFILILFSLSAGCLYTIEFTPCTSNTKGALITPKNCSSSSVIFIPNTPCNFTCKPGSKLSYSESSNSLTCTLCDPGTFSIGGGIIINSWNIHTSNIHTYCWVLEKRGWELGEQCTPWHSIGEEYFISGGPYEEMWYDTSAILYVNIVRPGLLKIVYRKESKIDVGTYNGEFLVFVNGGIKYVDLSSNNLKWNTVLINLSIGPQEIELVFSGYMNKVINKVQIKEIEIRGTEYASYYCDDCIKGFSVQGADSCVVCEIGTYLDGGVCLLCPDGTSSAEGSVGLESCETLKKCTQNDYHFVYSECEKGIRGKIYEWNFPLVCSNDGVLLPDNENVPCEKCPAGMVFNSASCEYCPEGYFTEIEGMSACLQCPPGRYAPKSLTYKDFSEIPKDFSLKCIDSNLNECFYSWEPRGTYLSTSFIYLPGWSLSLEKNLEIFHNNAYFEFGFEISGHNTMLNITLNGQIIKSFIGEFKGDQKFYLPKGNLHLIFTCIHFASYNENCVIHFLTVYGGGEGGAIDCLPCSEGFISIGNQSICDACGVGQTSDIYNSKCLSCSNNTFSDVPGPCIECVFPMVPNSDHSYCVLPGNFTLQNRNFMVAKLAGSENETSEYCKELRLQANCLDSFFGPVQNNQSFFYLSVGNPSIPGLPSFMSIVDGYSYAFAVLDKKDYGLKYPSINSQDQCNFDYSKLLVNLGSRVSEVGVTDSGFNLTYVNGSKCNEIENFSTEIQFLCKKNELEGWPVFVSNDECKFKFLWPTVHACSKCQDWEIEYKNETCEDNIRKIHKFSGSNCVFDDYVSMETYTEKCKSDTYYLRTFVIVSGVIGLLMVLLVILMCVFTVRTKFKYQKLDMLEQSGSMSMDMSPHSPNHLLAKKKEKGFPDFPLPLTGDK